jgi:hypothetical protein
MRKSKWIPAMSDDLLHHGEITVEGRVVDASNATLFVSIGDGTSETKAIYKPIAGERPLWDFPDGNLASRERAAYLVSEAIGIHCVPLTILRDGPFGVGAVQQWVDIDEDIDLELYFREDRPELREVALFDALINNTDRKIGHLLPTSTGKLFVCDHGVTFHVEDKLRTVLWQWAGFSLTSQEISRIESLLHNLERTLHQDLSQLITTDEIDALRTRAKALLNAGVFPHPNPEWPHIPWPPF